MALDKWEEAFRIFLNLFKGKTGIKDPQELMSLIITSPEIVPEAYRAQVAISAATEYERLKDGPYKLEAATHFDVAKSLTHCIYQSIKGRKVLFPQIHIMDDETTEEGVLRLVIEPNRDYSGTRQTYFVLKKVDGLRGRQAFRDSEHFKNDPNFRLEHILANISYDEGSSYLWKEFIIGPNLSYVLQILDRHIDGTGKEETNSLYQKLEAELGRIATQRMLYWQQEAPELIDTERNSESVIRDYMRKFVKILEDFSRYTDTSYSEEELTKFRTALENLDWGFIRRGTVVRNLAATYKNMVVMTGQINIAPERFIELFTENGKRRGVSIRRLEEALFFVDTSNKYSHALEDPWEMDLSLEGVARDSAVDATIQHYKDRKIDLEPGRLLMGIYRAYRKAALILSCFGPRNFRKFQDGVRSKEEYEEKRFLYQRYITHVLTKGEELLNEMSRCVPKEQKEQVDIFAAMLRRLSNYTQINYQNQSSLQSNS